MYCKHCGKEGKEGNQFCNYCGDILCIENPQTESQNKLDKELKLVFSKSLIFKIIAGVVAIVVLYIIFSQTPFSFLVKERSISQDLIASSVVNIICGSQFSDEITGGSGTIINSDGLIITNSHVIPQDEETLHTPEEGCLIILPDQYSGQPKEIYWAEPIVIPALSEQYDLAYLKIYDVFISENGEINGTYPKIFKTIFAEPAEYDKVCISSSIVKLGDPIRIYGYPMSSGGFNLTITDGIVSSLSGDGLILTSAKVDEGNSGGLAVDKKGCMVGIPSAISEGKYQNLGVIISTDIILEFSDEAYKLK